MKSSITLKLFYDKKKDGTINAEIIKRNGEMCLPSEKIEGPLDCGNHIAVVRDLVHNQQMDIDKGTTITITIEE